MDDRTTPTPVRRSTGRRTVLALVIAVAGLFGLALTAAGPAGAAGGYPIAYSVTNATSQTLSFESAQQGGKCIVSSIVVYCDKGGDYSTSVAPKTVAPGGYFRVDAELNPFSFRIDSSITVTYRIGGSGNDKVVLHDNKYEATCRVTGTKAYTCATNGGFRDFILRPAG
jgi:hypothetical protein